MLSKVKGRPFFNNCVPCNAAYWNWFGFALVKGQGFSLLWFSFFPFFFKLVVCCILRVVWGRGVMPLNCSLHISVVSWECFLFCLFVVVGLFCFVFFFGGGGGMPLNCSLHFSVVSSGCFCFVFFWGGGMPLNCSLCISVVSWWWFEGLCHWIVLYTSLLCLRGGLGGGGGVMPLDCAVHISVVSWGWFGGDGGMQLDYAVHISVVSWGWFGGGYAIWLCFTSVV